METSTARKKKGGGRQGARVDFVITSDGER